MARVVVLAGGIASGKSTVSRELKARGASCVDLDVLSREVTRVGSAVNERLAQAFGRDILDAQTGELRRGLLAQRAFASDERTRELESITHPAIRELLEQWLLSHADAPVCVVEVPLLDRVEDLLPLADEVLCVVCPVDVRRTRAVARGMSAQDFDARVAQQPSDEYLASVATTVLDNSGNNESLRAQVDAWWHACNGASLSHATN